MLNEENLGPTLFMLLQRLHESVVDIFRDNANHVCEPSSQAPILLLDAACTYKTILAGAERMNSKTEDSEAVHLALRLGLLFLSASYDDNIGAAGVGSVEPSPLSSPSEADTYLSINRCIIDGLERVAGLLSPGNPTETQLRGELARVVRSLACSAAHEQLQLDLTSPRHPHPTHGVDATASFSQRQRALIESRLQCARLLVERGLNCCSDAEYLLSSTPQDGSTLQRFLLQTVQEEFTTMRRLASGALAAFCDSSDSPATSLAAAEDISGATSSFHFYAPLALCCGGSAARHGRSSSTASASALSTGCITPRSRHAGDDGGWQLRGAARRGGAPQRLTCRSGAAVRWALSVVASLGADEAPPERYDKTSDFVDFVGDLVSVCAVVVRPFLTEQLEWMQRVQQEASSPTLVPDEAQAIQQCSLEDVEQYDGYVRVVERFLRRWDPAAAAVAAAQPSVSVALANTPVLLPPTASAAALGEANGHPPDATVVIELAEEPRWESMAPALADQLASAAANSKTSWAQVVSLFTGVKGFREAERAELWNYWAQLRNESALLASKVVRMQQRREALVQLKSLLFPLSGTSMEAMQSEWEERLVQRMQEMRETYVKYQHQPQKQY